MKVIYDNIIYSLQKAGGISAYWSELSIRLTNKDIDIDFYEYQNKNIFSKQLRNKVKKETFISYKLSRYLNFFKKLPKGSVFHSSYYRVANQKDVLNVTTIHDFTYEYFRTGLAKFIHTWQKRKAIKKSDAIICISKNTKKDLIKFCPNIKEDNIKVIYDGVSNDFFELDKCSEYLDGKFEKLKSEKYILYVGDRSSYKNFDIAVEIANELSDYSFVIVGGGYLNNTEIKNIKTQYLHFQGIDTKELNILYNNAFCLVYPSSYEGFGIPLVEAMQAGCPVVSTNISSIPEVVGDAALLVDDINYNCYLQEIKKLKNSDFRNILITKGFQQAQKFSWDKCAEETYEFYKKALKKKFG